jgi:hypothetical protein
VRRSFAVFVVALLGVIGISLSAGPANAAPLSPSFAEICNGTSGCIAAEFSFSNRSATAVGYVFDDRNAGSTTAVFDFYAGGNYFSTQTRTATNEKLPFHFGEQGPAGGINFVRVGLVANITGQYTWIADVYKI